MKGATPTFAPGARITFPISLSKKQGESVRSDLELVSPYRGRPVARVRRPGAVGTFPCLLHLSLVVNAPERHWMKLRMRLKCVGRI